ncbi:MAG: DUF86 domain-containing protein [Actinomycetota bacterium]
MIADIIEATEKIERYTAGLDHDAFVSDEKTIDSVARNLEIMGEAANRIPEPFKSVHPEVEWRRIVGLRNRIVHDYFDVDLEIIWEILQQELPALKKTLSSIHTEDDRY